MIELFYFVSMMVIGVSAPYFPPYLQGLGLSGRQIAERLIIALPTVKTHQSRLYEKLGVSERAAAVAEAMRRGLLE